MTTETKRLRDLELVGGEWVMDSRKIAELTGKNHRDVCRDIRVQFMELGGESKFASSYKTSQNKEVNCYKLPRRECLILVSGYNVKLRAAIIDRWEALEKGRAAPAFAPAAKPFRLPSGAQLSVMLRAVKEKVISSAQFVQAIGLESIPPTAPASHQLPLIGSPPEVVAGLEALVAQYRDKTVRTVAAVVTREMDKGAARMVQELKNGHLNFGGGRDATPP